MKGDRDRTDDSKLAEADRALRVLLVENEQDTAAAIVRDFGRNGVNVTVSRTLAESCAMLQQGLATFDVVISELRLPDGRGESLLPVIEQCQRQPVVIIASSCLSELAPDVLEYRPVAVSKPISTRALLRIVRTVAAGFTRPTIRRFARRFDLSRRETETIGLLAQGHGAKEIASQLGCSEKTVYFHLCQSCQKARCRNYHELVGRLFAFTCQALGHTPSPGRPSKTAAKSPMANRLSVPPKAGATD